MPFRQPAEWRAHAATWLAWPYLANEWGKHLADARAATVAFANALAPEPVQLLVNDFSLIADVGLGGHVTPVRADYGDTWLRDTGPIFSVDGHRVAANCFGFNGWGEKYDFPGDTEVATSIANLARAEVRSFDFVLEGGAVDVDGQGTALTTRQCLLRGNRNPGIDEAGMTQNLKVALGLEKVIWLDDGLINDHTDGHIDTLARFVGQGRVVCMMPDSPTDPNGGTLRAIESTLRASRDARDQHLEVITLPSPGRIELEGELLPASYCNFYIGNHAVAVPIYGCDKDALAVETIASLFPNRKTIAIDSYAVLTGGGALHCISQQQPSTHE